MKKSYLQEIYKIQKNITELDFFNKEEDEISELYKTVQMVFEILNSNMPNNLTYAMFSIFKCLEILVSIYIEEKRIDGKRYAFWKNEDIKIKHFAKGEYIPKPTTSVKEKNDISVNKIRMIIYEKLNIQEKEIHNHIMDITVKRNHTIHPPRNGSPIITKIDISVWFQMIFRILEGFNKE